MNEGNIITAEMLSGVSERKFIPLLREDSWQRSAPSWLLGKYYLDFRGDPYGEAIYSELIGHLLDLLPRPNAAQERASSQAGLPPSARSHSPTAATRQRLYTDFVNAVLRLSHVAMRRVTILKQKPSPVTEIYLAAAERDLKKESQGISDLRQQFNLLSSKEVMAASLEVAAIALAIEMASIHPNFEGKLREFHREFVEVVLGKFRDAVRKEAGLG